MIRFIFLATVLSYLVGLSISSEADLSISLPISPTVLLNHEIDTVFRKVSNTFSSIAESEDGQMVEKAFFLLLQKTLRDMYQNTSALVPTLSAKSNAVEKKLVRKYSAALNSTEVKNAVKDQVSSIGWTIVFVFLGELKTSFIA